MARAQIKKLKPEWRVSEVTKMNEANDSRSRDPIQKQAVPEKALWG